MLSQTIKPIRLQRVVFTEAIVENAASSANHHIRWACSVGCSRRPGDRESGRKVQQAADVALVFITDAEAESQIRPHAPVILRVKARVNLLNLRQPIATGNTELGGAAGRAREFPPASI